MEFGVLGLGRTKIQKNLWYPSPPTNNSLFPVWSPCWVFVAVKFKWVYIPFFTYPQFPAHSPASHMLFYKPLAPTSPIKNSFYFSINILITSLLWTKQQKEACHLSPIAILWKPNNSNSGLQMRPGKISRRLMFQLHPHFEQWSCLSS